MFSAYSQRDGRTESLRLLVRSLHGQLVDNLKGAISEVEGFRGPRAIRFPRSSTDAIGSSRATRSTPTAHTSGPVLKFSAELNDRETLRLAVEIADYASRLGEDVRVPG